MSTLWVYWSVGSFDLVYWDDPIFLTDNSEIKTGLTWAGLKWALSEMVIANWLPVTHLSFLVVSECFGTAPGPHHLVNALIHAANAALLFLLLIRLTADGSQECPARSGLWPAAFAAALFAWHPLRVESVAWISERKDVLFLFFFLLALLAYVRWVAGQGKPEAVARLSPDGRSLPSFFHPLSSIYYLLSLFFFTGALLSKPMAVSLPFILLLLDFWPLNRFSVLAAPTRRAEIRGGRKSDEGGLVAPKRSEGGSTLNSQLSTLLWEKWPFILLTLAFCGVTYWTQQHGAASVSWERLGAWPRLANAVASYVTYLFQFFWPVNLVAIYPYPESFDSGEFVLQAALLVAITLGCLHQLRPRPQLAFGWFWYLGTALPIIGLVQVGGQAHADRYTYLPLIGPTVALVWWVAGAGGRWPGRKYVFALGSALILGGLVLLTSRQLSYWRNTVTLFEQNVTVTPENGAAHFTLGLGYEHAGDTNRAFICYRVAKQISPNDPQPGRNLAGLLMKTGQLAAAEQEYGDLIRRFPDDVTTRGCLAGVMMTQGRQAEALEQLNIAVQMAPDTVDALNNLAWELATSSRPELRDGGRAVTLALRACELTQYRQTIYIGTLAAAYAEAGQFAEAVGTAQRAVAVAASRGERILEQRNRELMVLYEQHQPFHQPSE